MFRMLARLGAKPKSAPTPRKPQKLPTTPARILLHQVIPECSQRRGTYLRGSSVGSLAMLLATRRASSIVSPSKNGIVG